MCRNQTLGLPERRGARAARAATRAARAALAVAAALDDDGAGGEGGARPVFDAADDDAAGAGGATARARPRCGARRSRSPRACAGADERLEAYETAAAARHPAQALAAAMLLLHGEERLDELRPDEVRRARALAAAAAACAAARARPRATPRGGAGGGGGLVALLGGGGDAGAAGGGAPPLGGSLGEQARALGYLRAPRRREPVACACSAL